MIKSKRETEELKEDLAPRPIEETFIPVEEAFPPVAPVEEEIGDIL